MDDEDEVVATFSNSVPLTVDEFGREVLRTLVEFRCPGCDETYEIEVTVPFTDMPGEPKR